MITERVLDTPQVLTSNSYQKWRSVAIASVCALAVLLTAIFHCYDGLFDKNDVVHSVAAAKHDVDIPLILNSVASKHTFARTFAWWHSSWIPTVPFWRPLTIQTFWLESHYFGIDHFSRWMWFSVLAQMICLMSFAWFVYALTRNTSIVALAVTLFGVYHGTPITPNAALVAVAHVPSNTCLDGGWKNQPDIFSSIFMFSALALAVQSRYYAAILAACIATAFKESGWVTWPMLLIVLGATNRLREVPKIPVIVGILAVLTLVGLRYWSGPEVFRGYHVGSNAGWLVRYLRSAWGVYSVAATTQPWSWTIGNFLAVAILCRRRKPIALIIGIVGIVLGVIQQCQWQGEPIEIALVSYTDPVLGVDAAIYVAATVVVALMMKTVWSNERNRPLGLVAFGGVILATAPAVAAGQVQEHAMYSAYAFQAVFWAIAIHQVAKGLPLRSYRSGRVTGALADASQAG